MYVCVSVYRYVHVYLYIDVICRKIDNNDPSGRRDLLTGRHNNIDGSVEPKCYHVDLSINLSFHLD